MTLPYSLDCYAAAANPLGPFRGAIPAPGSAQRADYVRAVRQNAHVEETRRYLDRLLDSRDAEATYTEAQAEALDLAKELDDAEAVREFDDAFAAAVAILKDPQTDWEALNLPAYRHARAQGLLPYALYAVNAPTATSDARH